MKITGPTGIFGENRDYKTIIREPFANDLAHMFDEWTVPLRSGLDRLVDERDERGDPPPRQFEVRSTKNLIKGIYWKVILKTLLRTINIVLLNSISSFTNIDFLEKKNKFFFWLTFLWCKRVCFLVAYILVNRHAKQSITQRTLLNQTICLHTRAKSGGGDEDSPPHSKPNFLNMRQFSD